MNTKHNTQVLEKYLAIAADSVASLRQVDVERVLQSIESGNADGVTRSDIATFILTQRPDLAAEVTELMTELFAAENWTPHKQREAVETSIVAVYGDHIETFDSAASAIDGIQKRLPDLPDEVFEERDDDSKEVDRFFVEVTNGVVYLNSQRGVSVTADNDAVNQVHDVMHDQKVKRGLKADPEGAKLFFDELLASVETLGGIADEHGVNTLVDLMYLQQGILKGETIDVWPGETEVGRVVQVLPSAERWLKYTELAGDWRACVRSSSHSIAE